MSHFVVGLATLIVGFGLGYGFRASIGKELQKLRAEISKLTGGKL